MSWDDMDAHAAQWIGSRLKQEDAYAVRHFPKGTLALVCDGMGGHDSGDMASATAAAAFVSAFESSSLILPRRLSAALDAANAAVGRLFEQQQGFGGTTLVAAFAGERTLHWISVGDSALYLWRRGHLQRLNEDHSMRSVYACYVCAGGMTHREAQQNGHMLRSALVGGPIPMIDAPSAPYPLLPGDRILLCSDGAEEVLACRILSTELRQMLNARSGSLAGMVVEACRARQNQYADNVTVVTLDV